MQTLMIEEFHKVDRLMTGDVIQISGLSDPCYVVEVERRYDADFNLRGVHVWYQTELFDTTRLLKFGDLCTFGPKALVFILKHVYG